MKDPQVPSKGMLLAWRLGQLTQGSGMGVLLVFAVVGLAALFGDVSVFRYQGY